MINAIWTSSYTSQNTEQYLGGHTIYGMRHGDGVLGRADGSGYHGQWQNNAKHGFGVETGRIGTKYIYEGEWAFDKKHGNGVCVFNNGNSYVGQWKNNIPEGSGVFQWKGTGTAVRGKWVNGQLEGQAFVRNKNGFQYEAVFKNGVEQPKSSQS